MSIDSADIEPVDDDGDLLVEQHWVTILIGDATGAPRGTPPPDHAFPEQARARPVGRVTLGTTRDQTFRYAGESGGHGRHPCVYPAFAEHAAIVFARHTGPFGILGAGHFPQWEAPRIMNDAIAMFCADRLSCRSVVTEAG